MNETPKTTSDAGAGLGPMVCSHYPPAPDRFEIGDKRMFHWREYNGGSYEVYSVGLEQWAECLTAERAETVADALELFYASLVTYPDPATKLSNQHNQQPERSDKIRVQPGRDSVD